MGFGVWGFGFKATTPSDTKPAGEASSSGVHEDPLPSAATGLRVAGILPGFRVLGGFRVSAFGFRVRGLGFRVSGVWGLFRGFTAAV